MAASPTQTRSWYRPKGWFTEREEVIMVNRILRDDPSKGDMHNRQAVDLKLLWGSITDFDLWPIYLIGLTFGIPPGPPDQYLTLNLRNLGFDVFDSNLLSIPNQAIGAVTVRLSFLEPSTWKLITFLDVDIHLFFRGLESESCYRIHCSNMDPAKYYSLGCVAGRGGIMGKVCSTYSLALMAIACVFQFSLQSYRQNRTDVNYSAPYTSCLVQPQLKLSENESSLGCSIQASPTASPLQNGF